MFDTRHMLRFRRGRICPLSNQQPQLLPDEATLLIDTLLILLGPLVEVICCEFLARLLTFSASSKPFHRFNLESQDIVVYSESKQFLAGSGS